MEEKKRKPRKPETEEGREDRLQQEAHRRTANEAAEDDRIDSMIRRNIDLNGP